MQYLIEHCDDRHFVDNVRLAGEWGEDNEFILRLSDGVNGQIEIYPVLKIMVLQYKVNRVVLRYRVKGREREKIDIRRVIEVAWRPDIRRYASD